MTPARARERGPDEHGHLPARATSRRRARSSRARRSIRPSSTPTASTARPARPASSRASTTRSPPSRGRADRRQAGRRARPDRSRADGQRAWRRSTRSPAALKHLSFGKHVAVLTDARFSGVSTGACIGHVGPEALAGGPIGKLRDGDLIRIVVDRVNLEGSVDLVGRDGGASSAPHEGAPSCSPAARRIPTSPPIPTSPTTPASGRAAMASGRHLGRVRLRRRRHRAGAAQARRGLTDGASAPAVVKNRLRNGPRRAARA